MQKNNCYRSTTLLFGLGQTIQFTSDLDEILSGTSVRRHFETYGKIFYLPAEKAAIWMLVAVTLSFNCKGEFYRKLLSVCEVNLRWSFQISLPGAESIKTNRPHISSIFFI